MCLIVHTAKCKHSLQCAQHGCKRRMQTPVAAFALACASVPMSAVVQDCLRERLFAEGPAGRVIICEVTLVQHRHAPAHSYRTHAQRTHGLIEAGARAGAHTHCAHAWKRIHTDTLAHANRFAGRAAHRQLVPQSSDALRSSRHGAHRRSIGGIAHICAGTRSDLRRDLRPSAS
jgi:hypothetical protein